MTILDIIKCVVILGLSLLVLKASLKLKIKKTNNKESDLK